MTFAWLFKNSSLSDVSVYDINVIEIESDLVRKHTFESGNVGRIIALAGELEANVKSDLTNRVICVRDRDLCLSNPTPSNFKYLLFTDYSSLDIHLFDSNSISDLAIKVLRRTDFNADICINQMAPILNELFAIRIAKKKLSISLDMLPLTKYLSNANGELKFDKMQYVNNFICRERFASALPDFNSELDTLRETLTHNYVHYVHARDYEELLTYYLKKVCNINAQVDKDSIGHQLFGCAQKELFLKSQLFDEIRRRFR